jgi:Na+-transporting NADH:ubiquinone oxidoreductase subunit NqrC
MTDRYSMRWLAPVAALVAAPASAATYLSLPQAQAALFPGQTMVLQNTQLSSSQAKQIEKLAGTKVRELSPKVWRSSDGGWFYLDQVIGKHEFITYALALSKESVVSGIEILDYRETYGGEIRNPKWRAQFTDKRNGAPLKLDVDIVNLSGATLSCRNITIGVKRLLATHELLFKQQ